MFFFKKEIHFKPNGFSWWVLQIRTANDFWKWTKEVLVPSLYVETDYRGSPLAEMDPRIVKSMVAYRLGPVRLRQHRVTPGTIIIFEYFLFSLHYLDDCLVKARVFSKRVRYEIIEICGSSCC